MEETRKLFSQTSIAIATYFGGPAAAGYLLKRNYEVHNQKEKGNIAFIIGIISTILVFAILILIPEHTIDKVPNAVIPAIYTGIIFMVVEKTQGQWLKDHKLSGGEFYSGWKATGIGAIFTVIIFAVIFGIAFIEGDFSNLDFDAETYDKEVAKFVKNEGRSLIVFNKLDTAEPQYMIQEFSKGEELWKENIAIVKRLDAIDDLPDELIEQNKNLMKYCELRIQHYELFIKRISENTNRYDIEIARIGSEIEKVLEKLN